MHRADGHWALWPSTTGASAEDLLLLYFTRASFFEGLIIVAFQESCEQSAGRRAPASLLLCAVVSLAPPLLDGARGISKRFKGNFP